ncbi:GTPase-activating protein gyp8 [Dimargaris verticillata]|uniref:GTPase-activating protein gyp8 n=1 Tax=Dimargaris verticillata TaxID=2761393 RepID=A0A9W8B268_9FUNG|nr:GTPase-activating protein gyp8 [Dimargaris verticillata]
MPSPTSSKRFIRRPRRRRRLVLTRHVAGPSNPGRLRQRSRQLVTAKAPPAPFPRAYPSLAQVTDMAYHNALGLVSHRNRRQVWPQLLLCGHLATPGHTMVTHPDETQVQRDIGRTHLVLPSLHQQVELERIIVTVLRRQAWLRYYQGFNDVCTVFLLVLGADRALDACENAALLHFRDFMSHDFTYVHAYLGCIYTLVQHDDPELYGQIVATSLPPYFATSWLLTWFSHNLRDLQLVGRLFDFFLTQSPLMPVYVAAAELMALEPDFPLWHQFLGEVPGRLTLGDVNHLIAEADRLWKLYSPANLFAYGFHPSSCTQTYGSARDVMLVTMQPKSPADIDVYWDLADALPGLLPPPSSRVATKASPLVSHPLDATDPTGPALATTWPRDKEQEEPQRAIQSIWTVTRDRLKAYGRRHKVYPDNIPRQTMLVATIYIAAAVIFWLQAQPPL